MNVGEVGAGRPARGRAVAAHVACAVPAAGAYRAGSVDRRHAPAVGGGAGHGGFSLEPSAPVEAGALAFGAGQSASAPAASSPLASASSGASCSGPSSCAASCGSDWQSGVEGKSVVLLVDLL